MNELIVAVLGAGVGVLILRFFDKRNVDAEQKKLESKVAKNEKVIAGLEGEQKQEDSETQRKVDDIENEKNNKPSGTSLSDWFSNRK
jgi:hypothetical protein